MHFDIIDEITEIETMRGVQEFMNLNALKKLWIWKLEKDEGNSPYST